MFDRSLKTPLIMINGIVLTLAVMVSPVAIADEEAGKSPENAECVKHEKKAGGLEKQLVDFHQVLGITPEQETLWKDWSGNVLEGRAERRKDKMDRDAIEKLPVIERTAKWLDFKQRNIDHMKMNLEKMKPLYAVLTDAQKKIFDEKFPMAHHCR
jgi:hypothetical protein